MTQKTTVLAAGAASSSVEIMNRTKALLAYGILAGPIYIGVGILEILLREGFDLTRHDLSLMSNGSFGWIHIGLMVGTGLLTILGAIGTHRAMHTGRASTWGPRLIAVYGLGLIGAGLFVADPANGFPPGTPGGLPNAVSINSLLHIISGGFGFLALIAACFVFARRFAGLRQPVWAAASVATGVIFFAAFVGIASGSAGDAATVASVTIAFSIAVVIAWSWISVLFARLRVGVDASAR